MRNYIILAIWAACFGIIGFFIGNTLVNKKINSTKNEVKVIDRTIDKYTIENLGKAQIPEGKIVIEKTLDESKDYTSYLFSHNFSPALNKEIKKTTGVINIPNTDNNFPVIVMIRGYVDPKNYEPGVGTQHAAEVFAQHGFITVAPDFLGYGESDKETENVMESRFQTYTTVLSILNSISSIDKWDKKNIFIWGHSNGGQIALTVLEITGKDYPTVLWAPVSKLFPYSILYYTDDGDDGGKFLRREISKFEETYNSDLYSIPKYLDRIKAPIELHQGTADDAVPFKWSEDLAKSLKDKDIDVKYYEYPGSDHNLMPAWNQVVLRNIAFYQLHEIK